MFGLGTTELIIILVIVIMFFGLGKLPKVAKELGSGMRTFKKSLNGEDEDEDDDEEKSQNLLSSESGAKADQAIKEESTW